jgi:hypothetical protein
MRIFSESQKLVIEYGTRNLTGFDSYVREESL